MSRWFVITIAQSGLLNPRYAKNFWIYQSRTSIMSRWFVLTIAQSGLLNPRRYANNFLDLPIQNEQYEPVVCYYYRSEWIAKSTTLC